MRILLISFVCIAFAANAADTHCQKIGLETNAEKWCVPKLSLEGDLSKIFTIPTSKCQAISGLTCRITYNGRLPLPSEIFFEEMSADGKKLGKPIRLIYPHLKKGETGVATFRTSSHSAMTTGIILTGKWEGPWKDPY